MSGSFENKVVVVTGAGSGIGRSCAKAFAREGARIAAVDLDEASVAATAELIRAAGGTAIAIGCNVTRAEQIAKMIAQVLSQWQRIDVLHNNAGIGCSAAPTADVDEAEFDRVIAVNVKGVWLCMKHVLPHMVRQGGGVIVNTASALALTVFPNNSPYVASKHAVAGLTKTAAVEYAKAGIRINAVCPGIIATPLIEALTSDLDAFIPLHPMGRVGQADEVAAAVLWLASEQSSFVTGTLLSVDGGWVAS